MSGRLRRGEVGRGVGEREDGGVSNLERSPAVLDCGGRAATPGVPVRERLAGKQVRLGGPDGTLVTRLLPTLGRRLVGAWCFLDHYGPDDISRAPGMWVPPHPHIGLQTVSWLLEGSVHHRDSLGSDATIRPGELGLMTAGRGIAHSEYSPPVHPALLHGAQLWVALPGGAREVAPSFEMHTGLPVLTAPGLAATVLAGDLAGAVSPATVHTPLVGADLRLDPGARATLPLEPDFEYAVLAPSGAARVRDPDGDTELGPGDMVYLGTGRRELTLESEPGARLLLLGGEPFEERIVMWWNFVARDGAEIAAARADWAAGRRFGPVPAGADEPGPLAAPALPPVPLVPRGRTR
jgi:quercetin 2,3-dioxygenase